MSENMNMRNEINGYYIDEMQETHSFLVPANELTESEPRPVTYINQGFQGQEQQNRQENAPPVIENDIEFDCKFRGYAKEQVDDYIRSLTKDYKAICQKCFRLEQENEGLRWTLATLRSGW